MTPPQIPGLRRHHYPTPRAGPGAAVLNGRLHVFGGAIETAPLAVHDVFTPPPPPYAYDVRADDPDGDTLLYGLGQFPQGMSINSASGAVRWNPQINQAGEHDVLVQVDDNHGGKAEQGYKLNVVVRNHPPVIASTPVLAVNVGEPYRDSVGASDADTCETLSYALTTAPPGMAIDAVTGLITWTPTAEQTGQRNVVVRVTDSGGLVVEQVYVLAVAVDNHAPVISSPPSVSQWTQIHPTGTPPVPRGNAGASAYDEIHDRLILFSGEDGTGAHPHAADVWVLVNATQREAAASWERLTPTNTGPGGRVLHSVVYDSTANR